MNAKSTSFEFTCLGKRINEIVSAIFHSVIFNRCFGKFQYKESNSYSIGTIGFEEIICDFIDFTYIRVASMELAKHVNEHIRMFVDELRQLAMNQHQHSISNPSSNPLTHRKSSHDITTKALSSSPVSAFRRPSALFQFDSFSPPKHLRHHSSTFYAGASGSISLEFLIKSQSRKPFTLSNDSLIWEVWTLKINCLKDEANESLFNKTPIEDQLFDKILSIVTIANDSKAYLPQMPGESELDRIFDTGYPDVQPFNFKISYKVGNENSGTIFESRTGTGSDNRVGLALVPGQDQIRKIFKKIAL